MIDLTKKYRFRGYTKYKILALFSFSYERNAGNSKDTEALGVSYLDTETNRLYSKIIRTDGTSFSGNINYQLVEISPYDGWKENKEVYVTNDYSSDGKPVWWGAQKRHFSHAGEDGAIYTFGKGRSKFTEDGTVESWIFVKPAED